MKSYQAPADFINYNNYYFLNLIIQIRNLNKYIEVIGEIIHIFFITSIISLDLITGSWLIIIYAAIDDFKDWW